MGAHHTKTSLESKAAVESKVAVPPRLAIKLLKHQKADAIMALPQNSAASPNGLQLQTALGPASTEMSYVSAIPTVTSATSTASTTSTQYDPHAASKEEKVQQEKILSCESFRRLLAAIPPETSWEDAAKQPYYADQVAKWRHLFRPIDVYWPLPFNPAKPYNAQVERVIQSGNSPYAAYCIVTIHRMLKEHEYYSSTMPYYMQRVVLVLTCTRIFEFIVGHAEFLAAQSNFRRTALQRAYDLMAQMCEESYPTQEEQDAVRAAYWFMLSAANFIADIDRQASGPPGGPPMEFDVSVAYDPRPAGNDVPPTSSLYSITQSE